MIGYVHSNSFTGIIESKCMCTYIKKETYKALANSLFTDQLHLTQVIDKLK